MTDWKSPGARAQRIGLAVILLLGALDAWRYQRYQVNPDGVSYLDIARAFAAHGSGALINGYWSPLFPAVLGILYKVFPPTLETMYRMAHALTFAVFVVATFMFHRLLLSLRHRSASFARSAPLEQVTCVALAWTAYALLVLKGVGVQLVTPDLGVATVAFWLACELLALGDAPFPVRRWILVGAVLGLGYWWKAILFPVGLVTSLAFAWIAWRRRDTLRGPAAGAATYAILSLALIYPVSRHVGRPTFGETGRLNYLWYVNFAPYVWDRCRDPRVPDLAPAPFGRIRLDSTINVRPLTCAFSRSVPEATQPLWYDPSDYYREAHPRFVLAEQLRAIGNNLRFLQHDFGMFAPVLFPAFVLGALVALAWSASRAAMARLWPVGLLVAAPVAFYLLVYVELRHVSPFLAIACAAVPMLLLEVSGLRRRIALGALALLVFGDAVAQLSEQTLVGFSLARRAMSASAPERVPDTQRVARALREAGLAPGTRVASVYNGWNVEWAQLAGFVVRAVVPDNTEDVVAALASLRDPCTRVRWNSALRGAEIAAVVARIPTGLPVPDGFEQLAGTEFHLYRVPGGVGLCRN